jgi:hypothetical protein
MRFLPSLVPDWKRAHRWFTVRLAVLVALLSGVSASLPAIAAEIPPKLYHWIVFGLAIAIGFGRVIAQTPNPNVTPVVEPAGIDSPDKP